MSKFSSIAPVAVIILILFLTACNSAANSLPNQDSAANHGQEMMMPKNFSLTAEQIVEVKIVRDPEAPIAVWTPEAADQDQIEMLVKYLNGAPSFTGDKRDDLFITIEMTDGEQVTQQLSFNGSLVFHDSLTNDHYYIEGPNDEKFREWILQLTDEWRSSVKD